MVFFKDKAGSEYSTQEPEQFLSERAILRRLNQGIEITEQDIPVSKQYIAGVKNEGAEVFFKSKWFNGVLIQCDQSLIPAIESLFYVDRVEFVAPQNKLLTGPAGRTKFNLRRKNSKSGTETQSQLGMIGIPLFHQDGYSGEGLIVAVFDAGFSGVDTAAPFQHLFSNNQVDTQVSYDFVYNTQDVFRYDDHGTQVFSVISAEIPDVFNGGAPGASFQLYVTEDSDDEYRIEEYNWAFAAERADSAGVDIINSSLGYYDFDDPSMNYSKEQLDGNTTVISRAAQWTADRGIVVVTSAGNEGNVPSWRIISAPADAKDVLAVANVDAAGIRSSSSSIGPSADGRIKPDVAARGTGVRVVLPDGSVSSSSGTSLAAPLITSLVACVWQKNPGLTNIELMDLIKASGSQVNKPDNFLGYGIPNYVVLSSYETPGKKNGAFVVYPNPAADSLFIEAKEYDQSQPTSFCLMDTHGRMVVNRSINFSGESRLLASEDISLLRSGIYFVRILNGAKKYVYKIVKE